MKRKSIWVTMLGALFILPLSAQSYEKTASGIKTKLPSMDVEVQFYSPQTVRVLKSPTGWTYKKESLSVIKKPEQTKFTVNQQGDIVSLKSSKLEVDVNLKLGKISYVSLSGEKLLTEKENSTVFENFNDAGSKTYSVGQTFQLDKDEAIYGLGQHQNGKMNQRDTHYYMVQGNVEDVVTFFQSNKGYGLYWDNYSPTVFDDNNNGTTFKSEVGDCIDYYFMAGGNSDGVVAQMRDLTGQAPMFPLWTFGFWQSRERYKGQSEVTGVVNKYRELGVPLDGIIQDWQYWGNNYLWNAMDFQNPDFYDPKGMVDAVHKNNAHMIISIWSSFGPQTKPYRDLAKIGALYNIKTWPESGVDKWPPNPEYPSGVKVYDAYNPAARDIYWKYLNQGVFSTGMDGWWMDSTEPDHLDFKPEDMDTKTYLGSFRKVRNAYPLMTVGGVSEHQRKTTSDKRVFILTRSAFAGQQRYGVQTWSGDIVSTWESLRNQIPAGLNFSLSGLPYWNNDLGGFFAGKYNTGWNDGSGAKNPNYQELYVRWMQFGALTPMMRSHGTDVPREIYYYGKKGEPIYDALESSINLRYALLPYMYSLSWDVTNKQSSIMRALVMDFPKDKKVLDMNDEYMFGKSILVSPIIHAQYTSENNVKVSEMAGWDRNDSVKTKQNAAIDFTQPKSTKVYLPAGTTWYDFWTNKTSNGGQEINRETTIDMIPLFIKAGSILPIGPKVQYATEKKWDNLEVRVYPGADGEFTLYEDEGDNYNYEKGAYSTITFKWNDKAKTLTVGKQTGSFKGMLTNRKFNIVIAGAAKLAKTVSYSGKSVSVRF
jgi:Alpha-glucosidases, family 31 of glycosyl hydrolases